MKPLLWKWQTSLRKIPRSLPFELMVLFLHKESIAYIYVWDNFEGGVMTSKAAKEISDALLQNRTLKRFYFLCKKI